MTKKLFAACTSAARELPGRIETQSRPVAYLAYSENEAVGMGMQDTKATWPAAQGWSRHSCVVVEIPEAFVRKVYS